MSQWHFVVVVLNHLSLLLCHGLYNQHHAFWITCLVGDSFSSASTFSSPGAQQGALWSFLFVCLFCLPSLEALLSMWLNSSHERVPFEYLNYESRYSPAYLQCLPAHTLLVPFPLLSPFLLCLNKTKRLLLQSPAFKLWSSLSLLKVSSVSALLLNHLTCSQGF